MKNLGGAKNCNFLLYYDDIYTEDSDGRAGREGKEEGAVAYDV